VNAGAKMHPVLLESASELLKADFNNISTTNLQAVAATVD